MPCISFIVPVYNMERLLPRALRSLRAQTLTDFEAILINDGSKDGSAALCAQAVAEDARFRFIDQPNGGVATARNAGLDAARGEYIFFLDPDDWVEPDAAEVKAMKELLCKTYGKNSVELSMQEAPELIGGFRLRIGNYRIDASYATQLRDIRSRLLENR